MDEEILKRCLLNNDAQSLVDLLVFTFQAGRREYRQVANELLGEEAMQERERAQISEVYSEGFGQMLQKGLEHIKQHEVGIYHQLIRNPLRVLCQDPEFSLKTYLSQRELKEVYGLTDEQLRSLHQLGGKFLQQEEFEKAYELYYLLTLLDSLESSFFHGMAFSLALMGKHLEALPMYTYANLLNTNAVLPLIGIVECAQTLGEFQLAEEVLQSLQEVPESLLERVAWLRQKQTLRRS